jgi:DNA repair ATPase RecN
MDNENATVVALHALYVRLATLRSWEVSALGEADSLQNYQDLLEEAYAALAEVETEIDQLGAELEYHHHRLETMRAEQAAEKG